MEIALQQADSSRMIRRVWQVASSRWSNQVAGVIFALFVWYAYYRWASVHLPPLRFWIGFMGYPLLLVSWGTAFVVLLRRVERGMEEEEAWYRYMTHILWACNPISVTLFWVQGPYADGTRRTVLLLVCSALVSIGSIVTVRPPNKGPKEVSAVIMPVMIPAGLIAYYLWHPGEKPMPMVPLLFFYSLLMLALREYIQGAANEAHAALVAVQAQRDEQRAAKERFLAAASHDLDQPLASARLLFDQLGQTGDPKARAQTAQKIERALDSLQGIARQVTQHLQLDAGALAARREAVAIAPVLAGLIERNELAAAQAGVELRTLAFAGRVAGDPLLIERTLSNFIVNAIHHAKADRVLLGVKRRGTRVRLYVIDNGVGVAQRDRDHLFEDFFQGSDHGGEQRGGFGLGLSSARRMAALMDGQAGLEARTGQGSAFFLELAAA
jgi:signal transduction histidine kinase